MIDIPNYNLDEVQNGSIACSQILKAVKNGKPYEETPKGEWIRQPESRTIFFCSKCGREINTKPFTRTDNFPYCHCGAKMNEADNEC